MKVRTKKLKRRASSRGHLADIERIRHMPDRVGAYFVLLKIMTGQRPYDNDNDYFKPRESDTNELHRST